MHLLLLYCHIMTHIWHSLYIVRQRQDADEQVTIQRQYAAVRTQDTR
jgi:hypothetical protein